MSKNKKDWRAILKDKMALIIVVTMIAVPGIIIRATMRNTAKDTVQNSTNESVIKEAVEYAKTNSSFPFKVDEVTTATDITARTNAIRYHFLVVGADTSNLSEESIKESVIPSVCSKDDLKVYFNRGINLEYLYTINETGQEYLITMQKSDCA